MRNEVDLQGVVSYDQGIFTRRIHLPFSSIQEHQKLHQVLVAEENKRSVLLKKIYLLEVGGLCLGVIPK